MLSLSFIPLGKAVKSNKYEIRAHSLHGVMIIIFFLKNLNVR